jgi:lipopolysaccharide/colanic/teichoic acid biosynthesis glycosyltransferase
MIKVVFDRLVAAAALVLLTPVLIFVLLAVRLDSSGPGLFRQVRVGRGGRRFVIYKFRTMVDGAHRLADNISPEGDPRITRVGRVLRAWYLDELPQLLNVLKGDMSLVGPRPETPEYVSLYTPEERRILSVRPGLIGPSTLGFMDESERLARSPDPARFYATVLLHERVRLDLDYLNRRSLVRDVSLLCRQAWAILARAVRSETTSIRQPQHQHEQARTGAAERREGSY